MVLIPRCWQELGGDVDLHFPKFHFFLLALWDLLQAFIFTFLWERQDWVRAELGLVLRICEGWGPGMVQAGRRRRMKPGG